MEMESKHVLFLTNNQVERKPELNEDKQEKPANGGRYNKLKLLKRQRKKLERQEVRMEKEMFQGLKSFVWRHFGFQKKDGSTDSKRRAVCKFCHAVIKYSGNTTNLAAHLKKKHDISPSSSGRENNTDTTPSVSTFFPQMLSKNSKRAKSITAAISYHICKDLRPFSSVEGEGFSELMNTLEPRYTIPSRQYFSERCVPRLYTRVKAEVLHELKEAGRVAITADGWTSRSTEAYITVTCHYIDTAWTLKNYVLQTRVLSDSHTGPNLASVLNEACEEWHIADKNPALVTDNARNMTVAGIEAHLSPHIKCFGHTINLATQKGLKCNDAACLLGRVRRVVSFFHRSTLANAVLKEKQKLLDLPPHKLIQDVITRWNSSFDMVERFLEQQAAVCAAQLDQKIRKSMKNDLQTLNEEDMSTAEEIIQLLRPVKTATTIMCEEAQLTISVIAPLKSKLIEHFSVCEDDMPLIKEMKQTMAKELKHRYTDVQEVLNTAAALDARFKTLPFLCKEERDATFKNIINEAAHLWDQKEDTQAHDGTAMEETHTTHPSEEACDDELHASEYVPVSKKNQSNGGSVWGHIHC
ncbi:E3 SUMO-protein ligase ZBED1-like isoform X3 [Syngnathus typhle]|uniref:E3 SUMO-protein ligase ZBED1-like isoform X3 n=1 Tax=Syngnathus typhle TaxID=161592 RepID=UPI002A6A5464|nr:E3 SUMO-protein ligase ZBED1-like isoform X3 [Syngnathus typhle]